MSRSKTKLVVVKRQVVSKSKKASNSKPKSKRRRSSKIKSALGRSADTAAGLAFQRCTLAPFDFSDTGFVGIPDEYDGKSVAKRNSLVSSFPGYTAGNDLYIIQMPTPGVAYWYGDRAAGSTGAITLHAVGYDDSASLFPSVAGEDFNVSAFRYASNTIEFVPTVNSMTWGGSIEVWKAQPRMSYKDGTAAASGYARIDFVEGLAQAMNSLKPQSIFALKDGCYSPSKCMESAFLWTPPIVGMSTSVLTANQGTNSTDVALTFSNSAFNWLGLGNFETTIIKFPAIIASQTGLIRCESCMEYQVSQTSILYDYAHFSPTYDPKALAVVKAFHKAIPSAVPWKDNASFWENFCKWAGIASEMASYIPGPIGAIAKGFNGIFRSTQFSSSKYAK